MTGTPGSRTPRPASSPSSSPSQSSSSSSPEIEQLRRWLEVWWPDLLAGLLVLFAAFVEWNSVYGYYLPPSVLAAPALAMALAVVLTRQRPAWALGVLWALGLFQFTYGNQIMLVQLSIMYVAFGVARWGRPVTVWLSLISVPLAALGGLAYIEVFGDGVVFQLGGRFPGFVGTWAGQFGYRLMAMLVIAVILLLPWLIGLAVRLGVRASASDARASASDASREMAEADAARAQLESEQAREIAALREEQARLAADVHDVVGHSLAVILAQAESAQFLDDDPVVLKQTMTTIAASARTSLQDIRQVLAGAQQASAMATAGSFRELVDGVRASGHQVMVTEVGQPRPMPPELEVVAHRVVQEMLTNAIKHGRREQPLSVERHWPEGPYAHDLRIEVRNVAATRLADTQPLDLVSPRDTGGQGLGGMRRRLEAVGGKLDVRTRDEPEGPTFTVTAWLPVSGR
ncbi:sensor histidine kinase [Kineosporia succinea]|uniref:histidine kinase n=1 Tax=Kineosporia succinea TaxID=84632 RepID=A0ABT9P0W5_9ACTN|nr:histidine kinase [Kineosporia succinea]MDP9826318.1 signal transduction histidine kinase [Kineosporia succinea]